MQVVAILKSYKVRVFVIVGVSAAFINLLLVYILIDPLSFETFLLKNIANLAAMLLSTSYAFALNRRWTWKDSLYEKGKKLIGQYLLYNSFTLFGLLLRVVLFAFLDYIGIYYLFNVVVGIGVASVFNYIMYDKFVFRKEQPDENRKI